MLPSTNAFIEKNAGLEIQRRDSFIFLETSLGLKVKWNEDMDLFVTVDEGQQNNVGGLCGNYNGDPTGEWNVVVC